MKYFETFESFQNSASVDEGLFSFLGRLFSNPKKKRELDKLAAKLTQTRIEIGILKLDGDPIEELENELEDKSYDYKPSRGYNNNDNDVHQTKIDILQELEDEIINQMDDIGRENDALDKYVSKVKLESRMASTQHLMRHADGAVAKVMAKLYRKDAKGAKDFEKQMYKAANESLELNEEKAKGDRGPIDNPDIEKALKTKAEESGIDIALLRIVMRRGMDAWNTTHREGMSQEQWGYARVNGFIKKEKGTWGGADVDVAREVKGQTNESVNEAEETYNDYPAAAKANAKKAIEWKEKYGREEVTGGTAVGWARAHQLAKGESLSADVVSRMAQFNRHRKNSEVAAEFKDTPWKDRGYIAWLIWGGTEGVDWAMAKMDEIQNEAYNINKYSPMSYAKQIASGAMTMQDAMKETGLPFTELMKLVKKIDKNFKINFESKDMKHFKTFESFVNEGSHKEAENIADQITGQIQDMINNDEEVDGAYYLVKDYFEGDTRNPLFNMVVDLVGKWMKKNKI
jgi:hypothetical protein